MMLSILLLDIKLIRVLNILHTGTMIYLRTIS